MYYICYSGVHSVCHIYDHYFADDDHSCFELPFPYPRHVRNAQLGKETVKEITIKF